MTYRILPALVRGAVVGVVLSDVAVYAAQGELLVGCGGHGLHDQLRVAVGRLGIIPRLARLAVLARVPHVTRAAVPGLGG